MWIDLTPSPPLIPWCVVLGATLAAAVTDLWGRRIHNALTFPVALMGIVWNAWTGGWIGAADSVAAMIVLALPFVFLFVFAGGGAGDAKLMGAIGAWLGLMEGAIVMVAVALCGIVLAVVYAAAQKRLRSVSTNIAGVMVACLAAARARSHDGVRAAFSDVPATGDMVTIPYGIAIFVGTCFAAGGIQLWHG